MILINTNITYLIENTHKNTTIFYVMNRYQLDYKFRDLNSIEKQELWRQKQFQIFYGNGRPIFNIDKETQHIKSHNNPYFHKDILRRRQLDESIWKKILKENNT